MSQHKFKLFDTICTNMIFDINIRIY